MTVEELVAELKKDRARCCSHCGTWNREDRDCEIYGNYHPSPAKCRYFLETEVERRNKYYEELDKWQKKSE